MNLHRKTTVVALLLTCLWLVSGCVLPPPPSGTVPPPTPDGSGAPANGAAINVAALARLGETEQIEIEQLASDPNQGYQLAATIADPAIIDEFVDVLDTNLELGPRVTCLDQYRLRFTRTDGTVHEFGYFCEPDGSFLHGDAPFLEGYDVQPPARLHELIQEQLD